MNTLTIIFSLGIILGIALTLGFCLYFLQVKCPSCKKKRKLLEIIQLDSQDKTSLAGQPCQKCQQLIKSKLKTNKVVDIS